MTYLIKIEYLDLMAKYPLVILKAMICFLFFHLVKIFLNQTLATRCFFLVFGEQ